MAGIEEIAAKAGVSPATVSRALRGLQHVNERTRQKVIDAADSLGYPSKAAAVIAEAEGVTPTTIHNRLQLARSGGYLDTPGRGSRG